MGITADELVKMMDEYMGSGGYYMKPKVEADGKSGFYMAKDQASSSAVDRSLKHVEGSVGEKEQQPAQVFTGKPGITCAMCADIPNLMDIVDEDE